jgi:hypothetical protein
MSLSRPNPLSIEVLGTLQPDDLEDKMTKLHSNIRAAADSRSSWIEKQERLLRQRRGIRRKKTFPWPGAANHNWPLTDGIVRRWKPGISSLILNADPVTYFHPTKPQSVEGAVDAQNYYHHQFHQIPNVTPKSLLLTDWIAQHGRSYSRQGWDFKTRKSCRIVRTESLFPGGVAAAFEQFVNAIEGQRAQAEQAVAQGQAPEEVLDQIPATPDIATFVRETLQDEYQIGINDEPLESQQLEQAVQLLLQGAKQVKFYYQVIEADRLAWEVWSPMNVIFPPRCKNEEDAEFIVFIHEKTGDDIRKMGVDGHILRDQARAVAEKMEAAATTRSGDSSGGGRDSHNRDAYRDIMDQSQGIDPRDGDAAVTKFEVWEVLTKMDIDGDGIKEKVIIWLVPSFFQSNNDISKMEGVLAVYAYPMPFEEWNVVAFDFEKTTDSPYGSRGIAELVSVFQAQVNSLHNARLDSLQIVLSPMFTLKASGPTDSIRRNIRFMPGTIIPLPSDGDFAPIQTQAADIFQSLNEENFTRSLAEQYIGVFDPGILQQNAAERRTATEVEAVLSQVNSIAASDAALFQANMGKVHRQLWKLLMEFGPEEIYFRVMGEEQPKFARKIDIDNEYEIVPAGTPINTQKQLVAARAREALTILIADQTGLINKRELYRQFLSTIDNTMAKRILRTEEEAAAVQAIVSAANQQAEEQGGQPTFESF